MPYLTSYGQLSNGEPHFLPDAMFGQPGALGSTPFLGQHGLISFPAGLTSQLGGIIVLRDSLLRALDIVVIMLMHLAP